MPFFVPLRRYAGVPELPGPEAFTKEVGRHIADEMPDGWVQAQLRSGRGIVLIDGIDELAVDRRAEARRWLSDLVAAFPRAHYVVTSRPAAAPADWLGRERFSVAELEPMSRTDVPEFVRRWHQAMRHQSRAEEERSETAGYEARLITALENNRHLRQLGGYPLMCALLCALHRDRRAQLPDSRMEVYEVALHMILERRDTERQVVTTVSLSRTETTLLLEDLAYWLIRNEWSDATREQIVAHLETKLRAMPRIAAEPIEVYRTLLERSGLLRESVEGRGDFVHRTFQEYLAARQAVNEGDIGALVSHAHLDQWQEVVVMAAGHATLRSRAQLLSGLIERSQAPAAKGVRDTLRLLALACVETSPELPPEIVANIRSIAQRLLPPKSSEGADAIGRAGPFVLDLLAASQPTTEAEVAATIRAAAAGGDPAALSLLARFSQDGRPNVTKALIAAWARFDPEEYAQQVLRHVSLVGGSLDLDNRKLMPALAHIKHLRELRIPAQRAGELADLSPLSSLDQLRSLYLPEACDLSPLSGLRLTTLVIDSGSRPIRDLTVDLSPLAGMPTLERFATPYHTRNVTVLLASPALRRLGLRAADAEQLAAARPALALDTLEITDALHRDLSFIAAWPTVVDLKIDDGLLLNRDRVPDDTDLSRPDLQPVRLLPQLRVLRLWGPASPTCPGSPGRVPSRSSTSTDRE
ncbi:hypothetical protein Psuf_011170 [Phytohabitans suffuscus]|uniref:NACHT domain-containing protein n=1 Tax=Phytohabitans suffuscus TaxID=624315 RepID=A0A6F8YCE5_9ACTN|nr:hypothetical protein Psuf_011170 [Phytohabitans suffuscus]